MKKISRGFFNGTRQSAAKLCKCWRIELDDGTLIGFTEHDKVLTLDDVAYQPTNAFSSSAFAQKTDMSVANINVVALMSDLLSEQRLHAGEFDRAKVRIFYVLWDQPHLGMMPIMGARFGEITFRDGDFETELRSLAQAMQQRQGRTYGLECDADLGDARCGRSLADITFEGTVQAISDTSNIFFDRTLDKPDDYFQYGRVLFDTGLNAGLQMDVAGYKNANGVIVLLEPTAYPITPGDTYRIIAGCDKTKPTCKTKFANLINFQGFPDMPTEQQITETPNAK